MSAPQLTNRSVHFQGSDAAFWAFCAEMNIAADRVYLDRSPEDFTFMSRHENHLDGGALRGDFRLYFDILLWDRDDAAFQAGLLALSRQEMALAIDADDDRGSPWAVTLFLDGAEIPAEILDDELGEERYIYAPIWVRSRLKAMAPVG